MSLKDDMAADLESVFLNDDEFADAATYYPRGSATGFAVVIVLGDISTSQQSLDGGIVEADRTCQATLSRAVVRAGMLAHADVLVARDPIREDKVVIASGDNAGTWYIAAPAQTDVGGGLTVTLVRDDLANIAGKSAVEVR